MTGEDDATREEPHHGWDLTDEALAEAGDWIAELVSHETGIRLDPTLEVDGSEARWVHHGTELAAVSLQSHAPPDSAAGTSQGVYLGELLVGRAEYGDLKTGLVRATLDHLRAEYLDEIEAAFSAALAESDFDAPEEVDLEFVELGYDYRHGDPPDVYERGYPPFGLEVYCWEPEVEVVVRFGRWPDDGDELASEAVARLQQEVSDR